ncbi:MAG: Uncharacterised protein [Owenweeksia sp. TMED14]|nr:MAG: Uncharacterised protein [Owenweeksia sp. TMED14]
MINNINYLIDELALKIKAYHVDKILLTEAVYQKFKLRDALENVRSDDGGMFYTNEDLENLENKYESIKTNVEWLTESVDVSLYAIKYAAYKLGRTRSRTRPEP